MIVCCCRESSFLLCSRVVLSSASLILLRGVFHRRATFHVEVTSPSHPFPTHPTHPTLLISCLALSVPRHFSFSLVSSSTRDDLNQMPISKRRIISGFFLFNGGLRSSSSYIAVSLAYSTHAHLAQILSLTVPFFLRSSRFKKLRV